MNATHKSKYIRSASIMICFVSVLSFSCLPPVYYTAEVEPQASLTLGGGYVGYGYFFPNGLDGPWDRFEEAQALRLDFCYRYAGDPNHYITVESLSKLWERLAIVVDGSLLVANERTRFWTLWDSTKILTMGEIGLEYEFCEHPSLSAQVGIVYPYPSLTLLAGIPYWPGKREIITIGVKTLMWMPYSVFATVHPLRWLHFSIQTNPATLLSKEEWEIQCVMGIDLINTYSKCSVNPRK